VNAFDYLVALQRHRRAVRRDPARWLPWNHEAAMAELTPGADQDAERAVA